MNAMSDFERHNTGGHSLFNFVAKNKSYSTTSCGNHVPDDLRDLRREIVSFLFCQSFRKVNILLLTYKQWFGKYPSVVYLYN